MEKKLTLKEAENDVFRLVDIFCFRSLDNAEIKQFRELLKGAELVRLRLAQEKENLLACAREERRQKRERRWLK